MCRYPYPRNPPRQRPVLAHALPWVVLALLGLSLGMPQLEALFHALFPELSRPVYAQESFARLLLAHGLLVLASSSISVGIGISAAVFATREAGRDFKPLIETLVAMGQTFPPVAVLAVTVPLIGFGFTPALVALVLYGLLPVVQASISGIEAVPASVMQAARGMGLTPRQQLWQVELPLALPVMLAGVRTSVSINIGTATVAALVGAPTLGSPILIGLQGFNTAYVIQGALLVGLLAVSVDLAFESIVGSLRNDTTSH